MDLFVGKFWFFAPYEVIVGIGPATNYIEGSSRPVQNRAARIVTSSP